MTGENPTWDDIDGALGLVSSADRRPEMVGYFQEAGFSEEQARRGAELMESGMYFDFVDVATSLAGGYQFKPGAAGMSPIQRERIAAVGLRVAEAAAQRSAASSGGQPSASDGSGHWVDEPTWERLMARSDRLRDLEEQGRPQTQPASKKLSEAEEAAMWGKIDAVLGGRAGASGEGAS